MKRIVIAYDGSDGGREALEQGLQLARNARAAATVVYVRHAPLPIIGDPFYERALSKELLRGRAGGHPIYVNEDELQEKIRRQAEEIREEGVDVTLKIETGAAPGAAHMIADVAREVGADVILVGTRGHTAIGGLLLGSVTQRLLHIAPCPVLAVPVVETAQASHEPEREKVEVAQ